MFRVVESRGRRLPKSVRIIYYVVSSSRVWGRAARVGRVHSHFDIFAISLFVSVSRCLDIMLYRSPLRLASV